MGTLESLHEQHKARQLRIKRAAINPPPAQEQPQATYALPEPEPESGPNLISMTTFDIFVYGICEYYNVRKLDLLSQRKINKISDQRHMLVYMLHRMTDFTNGQLAPKMNRDPTTIGYAIHKIMNDIDAKISEIEELEQIILSLLEQRKAALVSQ